MAFTTSMIKRTKREKLLALTGALAVKIARAKGDPLYGKMIKFKRAYKMLKRQIITKYKSKAYLAARRIALK